MKILSSAIQALLCFSVLGSSAVWGNGDVNDEIVTTRSSEIGDAASIYRDLRLGDGSDGNTIINGEPLGISRYPYLVHLFTVNATGHGFVCGGSLVANDMVLTAAHCIQDRIAAKVQINRNEWTDTTVGEEINAKEFIFHPQWNKVALGFDYALIVLERATTEDIKLIELNSDENFPAPGSAARVMGWGKTETGSLSDVALKVDVNVISKAECAAYWDGTPINAGKNLTIDDFHICTFEQGQGGCQGDSGGPLIIPGASPEQDVQVGIVSFGTTYCIQAKSDVYARVSNQFDWIKKNLCSKSKSETSFDCSTKSAKAAKNAKKM